MPNDKIVTGFIALLSAALLAFCIYLLRQPSEGTLAPPPDSAKSDEDNISCALKHFKRQGYRKFITFENVDGDFVHMGHKIVRDDDNIFRAEGALVYPDGESSTFSVGLIYGEGAWSEGTAKTINRRHSKRHVSIETVIRHDDIRDLAVKNDYVIPVGLASNEDENESDKNLQLAFARAHNLGLAVNKLGWQPTDRIWPNTLGYALKAASTESEELKQRPVMLIGANARRPVKVSDVSFSAIKIAPQDRIIAEEYLFASNEPKRTRNIYPDSTYLEYTDIKLVSDDSDYVSQVLPAVEQTSDSPIVECED